MNIRINAKIADACLAVLERQSWWLGERLIVLSLFSKLVSDDEKSAVAAALLREKPETPIEPGKPDFPLLRTDFTFKDFVGPQSWVFFHHLEEIDKEKETKKYSTAWLTAPPQDWPEDGAFRSIKEIVDALHGVNDCAERGCRTAELFKVINYVSDQKIV